MFLGAQADEQNRMLLDFVWLQCCHVSQRHGKAPFVKEPFAQYRAYRLAIAAWPVAQYNF
jgi:hypothetical protein